MSKLDAIFGSPGDTAVDPVCDMTVPKESPPGGVAQHNGATYYFCAPGCREEFAAHPEQYA